MQTSDADIRATEGLTAQEAARRMQTDGPNELPSARPRTWLQIALGVVREPMLLLLLGAGSVNFMLAEPMDGVILMSFVLVVMAITFFQERRTERAIEALRDLSSPRALVVRDGIQRRIAGREVVRGDVVLLAEGDRVPADGVLLECMSLSVDESLLTGESVPVRKSECGKAMEMGPPGGEATPWVFSGTLVVKGQGVCLVREIASATELGRIGTALAKVEPERTPLQREVGRLVRRVLVAGLVLCVAVGIVFGLTRSNWLEATLAGITLAMAMLPEEFPVVLTVFLALGAWRLSQRNVLVRRMPVVETLGSATVLLVDKTGTLTTNRMRVRDLVVDDEHYAIGEGVLPERFHQVVEYAVLASPVDPFDPMDTAFKDLGVRYLADTEHLHVDWTLVREYPLSEHLLALSHVWRSPDGSEFVIAAKGAPEAIADLCHLTSEQCDALDRGVDEVAGLGRRVLGVARARFRVGERLPAEQHDFDFEFVGLVGLADPVREGVPTALRDAYAAGIRVVMITGDYPGTAISVAREIGLQSPDRYVMGPDLPELTDDELAEQVATVSIFARMVPEQKQRIVRALRAMGEVVAMTGDGVNDAPALKTADIGIAMGERGTDVAREASAIVLTDDDFTSIVGAIRQGRRAFDNLRKAMAYIIAVHVPIAGMSLIPVLAGSAQPLVLLPMHIAFLELIIDPACSVVFEAEGEEPGVMERPPRPAEQPLFTRRVLVISVLQGASVLAAVFAVYWGAIITGHSEGDVRALTFAALVAGNLGLIVVNRSWTRGALQGLIEDRNPALGWVLGAASVFLALVMTVPALREMFRFAPVHLLDTVGVLAAALAGVAWFEVYKFARDRRKSAVSER